MNKNKKRYDKYKKFDVVYADFGRNPHGVQGGIRPGIVVNQQNVMLILVTHDPDLAQNCDVILTMDGGRITDVSNST